MRRRLALLAVPGVLGACWLGLPTHSLVGALRPGLEAADEDEDGQLTPSELARSSPTLISFHKIDTDGDGSLSEPELLVHLVSEDPTTFDGPHGHHTPSIDDAEGGRPSTKPARVLHYLFEFMLVEVTTVDKRVPLPSDEQLEAAAATGSLDSPESRLVCANLVAAYQATGLQIPPFLADVQPELAQPGLRQPHPQDPGSAGPEGPRPPRGPGLGPPPGRGHPGEGRPPGPPDRPGAPPLRGGRP